MFYLIEQYFWFLVVAFIVGTFVGWWSSAPRHVNEVSDKPAGEG